MRKKQHAIQSLLQNILKPATAVLLDTIDATMNSNTMLFKVRSDQFITTSNVHDILNLFLHNPLFREMFFEVDHLRRLLSYTTGNIIDGQPVLRSHSKSFVQEHFQLILTPMNEHSFAERLHWMLTAAFSPYQTHINEQYAQELLKDFFGEVFTSQSWLLEQSSKQRYWDEHAWSFYDVTPNFLHSTGYFHAPEGYDPPDFAYFERGEDDTCTFFTARIFSISCLQMGVRSSQYQSHMQPHNEE